MQNNFLIKLDYKNRQINKMVDKLNLLEHPLNNWICLDGSCFLSLFRRSQIFVLHNPSATPICVGFSRIHQNDLFLTIYSFIFALKFQCWFSISYLFALLFEEVFFYFLYVKYFHKKIHPEEYFSSLQIFFMTLRPDGCQSLSEPSIVKISSRSLQLLADMLQECSKHL